ncbi:MAG: hypothetical protein NTX59_00860 [Elusimicrobia bacterium]|nr:hypothetical protein [Elusimicrobiota bacterium]
MINNQFSGATFFRAVAVVIFSAIACQASSSLYVYTEGQGVSQDAAIQSALRTAIEQHLGVFISGEQLVKNHELVSQEITTYSKGFVKGYEIIDQTVDGSNYRVKLAAELLPEKISESISKHSELKINGSVDYINMQLEKERRSSSVSITKSVIDKLIRTGYIVTLDKIKYDTANTKDVAFSIGCGLTLNKKVWKEGLALLKKLKIPSDSGFELVTGEYDQDNTPSFSIKDTIPVWLG